MQRKYNVLLILLLGCISYVLADEFNNRLDFTGEDLTFKLNAKQWQLDGDYMFSNYSPEDIRQNIYFPIPADSSAMPAQDISIRIIKPLAGQNCTIININPKGFWFELTLPAQTIAVCKIKYKQKLIGKKAHYILLTANSWGKPLEYASYTLFTPKKLKITSMPLDAPIRHNSLFNRIYQWSYTNYAPDRDFIVEFE